MQGWLTCPVIGDGSESNPIRAAVAEREESEGDRLEFVIGTDSSCLVAYDVEDPSTFSEHEIDAVLLAEVEVIGREILPIFEEDAYLGEEEAPPTGSFLEDTFTGTNGTLLQEHTGEKGATWVKGTGSNELKLTSNRIISTGTSAYRYYYASGLPAAADYTVQCGIYCMTAVSSGMKSGPAARINTTADTSYQFGWETGVGYSLLKRVAGIETILGTYARIGLPTEEDIGLLSVVGTAIKGFVAGTERVSALDSEIAAAGRAGIRCQGTSATGGQINFVIGTDVEKEKEESSEAAARKILSRRHSLVNLGHVIL